MSKIGVIGAGKWGSALAFALSEKNDVLITSRTPRDLPNFVSLEEILELEYLVIAIPAQQVSSWLKENFVFKNQKILVFFFTLWQTPAGFKPLKLRRISK